MAMWKKKIKYDPDANEHASDYEAYYYRRAYGNTRTILFATAIILSSILALVLLLLAGSFYADRWLQAGKIHNVRIGHISLEGLTVDEATALLSQHKNELLPKDDIIVKVLDETLILTYTDTKAELNVASIANTAYLHGRNDNMDGDEPVSLDPLDFVNVDAASIRALLKAFVQPFNGKAVETSATISGERPDLNAEPVPGEANQILTITVGSPTYLCDPETIFQTLKTAHRMRNFIIEGQTKLVEPEPPSASAIFREFCLAPVNATIDPETSLVTESAVGYGFNISEVQKLLDEAAAGEIITIPLMRLEPSVTTDALIGTNPKQ